MEPQQVADIAGQLDTDDAVALIEDLDRDDQQAVLRAMEPDDRAAVEEALGYPEESAGRLMQRDLCAVPEHWKVGQVIDYLRSTADLPTDFWEVFVVSPNHHPVGTCKLSTILRTPRGTPVSEIMSREQTLIPVDMDQEDVALRFQKYALVSAAVTDDLGRLVGMITVDDVVHIIQQEAGEDITLLSGAGEGDINEPIRMTVRTRVVWLIINLGATICSASVVGLFQGEIRRYAILAALMPMVSALGGNAGTQTLAVVVRALATNQLTSANTVWMLFSGIPDRDRQRHGAWRASGRSAAISCSATRSCRWCSRWQWHQQPRRGPGRGAGAGHARQVPDRSRGIVGSVRDDHDRRHGVFQFPRPGGPFLVR